MRKSKAELITYFVLRAAVLAVLVAELVAQRWSSVFTCLLTLLLFMIPSLVERRLKLEIPRVLEIVILLFIFAAEILGEIAEFYVRVAAWDAWLHTVNGFLMAAIGFGMIDLLNRSPRFHISLSPLFVAFVAFCFSMTIGVLWEFFEYFIDQVFIMDMQKDTVVQVISSVALHPNGNNIPVIIHDITETTITGVTNGVAGETVIAGGYLDVGLHDTMKDMFVNCLGALVFSVIGAFYIRNRGGRVAGRFIPKLMTAEQIETEAEFFASEKEKRRQRRRQRFSYAARGGERLNDESDEDEPDDDEPKDNEPNDEPDNDESQAEEALTTPKSGR